MNVSTKRGIKEDSGHKICMIYIIELLLIYLNNMIINVMGLYTTASIQIPQQIHIHSLIYVYPWK